jgi:hypothetical protein
VVCGKERGSAAVHWPCALAAAAALCAALGMASISGAAEPELTQEKLEALLADEPAATPEDNPAAELAPPPPAPRRHGVVIEGSLGALGHLGEMRNVSPTAPWFRVQAGYELFDWLMLLGQGDVAFSTTRYASRPPEPRSYALFGFGVGARFTWQASRPFGFYFQADGGLASINQAVLSTYGYSRADRINPYFGGLLGVDWYPINPHYAVSLYGGARDYVSNFERSGGGRPPLVWLSGLALRYAL